MTGKVCTGAWMTDIDDTLIESGLMPDDKWIQWLSEKISIFKRHNIAWIPMSGVAIDKLGPRILYRLPHDLLSHVLYYGGDGSQKYFFDDSKKDWGEDNLFRSVFSDSQGIAVLGKEQYRNVLKLSFSNYDDPSAEAEKRIAEGCRILEENNISSDTAILEEMKLILNKHGYDADMSETYFRGGSVSWMMLGDISAEPYKTEKAAEVRKEIISFAEKKLEELNWLSDIGERKIIIPFPGARGIKFVLKGNSKEKATRNIISTEGISAENIVFAGNEIFKGGNDNMIRNIDGITLLSVGEKTDPGKNVVYIGYGVDANMKLMNSVCEMLEAGVSWRDIIEKIKMK